MREIKFRGIYRESFVFGSLILGKDGDEERFCQIERPYYYEHMVYDIDQVDTIGQYIGQKDNDGVEIFEGDTLESYVDPEIPIRHVVEWSEKYSAWYMRNVKDIDKTGDGSVLAFVYFNNTGKVCKVVGNIHE